MTQNSNNLPSFFPKDLTPQERAILKLISHFAIIFVFNAILAALTFLGGPNKIVNVGTVITCVVAQGVLALLDALKKYYSAQGDASLSTLFDLAKNEVASKAPAAPQLSANEQALQKTVNQMVNPLVAGVNPATAGVTAQQVANAFTPAGVNPATAGVQVPSTALRMASVIPSSVPILETLPTIPAVTGDSQATPPQA